MRGRLGRESVFLILVAALAGLLEPGWPLFVLIMAVALLLVVAFEALIRRRPQPVAVEEAPGEAAGAQAEAEAEPAAVAEPAPVAAEPGSAGDELREQETAPTPALAPAPSIAPLLAPPEPSIAPVEDRQAPEPAAAPPSPPREWNLSELEQLARERAGADPVRDQERSFLLVYLRAFVRPDGSLPRDFDGLVRESFGDLLSSRL